MARTILLLLVLGLFVPLARAGENPYRLYLVGGAGYTAYIADTPPGTDNKGGFSGTVRVLWKPDHRLSLGIETGYLSLYSIDQKNVSTDFGPTDIFALRSAVPIAIVFTMDIIEGLQITVGGGEFIVYGTTESFGNKVSSSALTTSFMGAASYFWPVNEILEIGGEAKWYHASKFEDTGLSFQVMGRWKFLQW